MKKLFFLLTIILTALTSLHAQSIRPEDCAAHIGDSVTVCGKIYGGKFLDKSSSKLTLLNMGAAYPDQHLTIVVVETLRSKLGFIPEEKWKDKNLCVSGKVELYKDKPQIIVIRPEQVKEGN